MRIAIIPARGGSKRIPRKNIKDFRGKPIIAYSIEAAQKSNCFDRIIVSTDDKEIANTALEYGAEVPFIRPPDLSDDYATTTEVINHCITWLKNKSCEISSICCIYATAPFISMDSIQKGAEALLNPNISYAFSATHFPFPIQRAITLSSEGLVEMLQPEHMLTRSQDLTDAYHDAGQFYWGKADAFLANTPIFSNAATAIILPTFMVQDIDTPDDWIRAEAMHEVLERMEKL